MVAFGELRGFLITLIRVESPLIALVRRGFGVWRAVLWCGRDVQSEREAELRQTIITR